MRILLVLTALLTFTGCAQWQELTQEERKTAIIAGAVVVGAVALGVAVADDDNDSHSHDIHRRGHH